jgi:hypothetical protein
MEVSVTRSMHPHPWFLCASKTRLTCLPLKPRKPMAYSLPLRPFLTGWTLGPSASENVALCHQKTTSPLGTSTPPRASSLQPCHPKNTPHVDDGHTSQVPRLSSPALQHFRYPPPFFPLSVPEKRLKTVALVSRSPAPRVWLPSLRC